MDAATVYIAAASNGIRARRVARPWLPSAFSDRWSAAEGKLARYPDLRHIGAMKVHSCSPAHSVAGTRLSFVSHLSARAFAMGICSLVVGCADAPPAPPPTIAAASPPARIVPIDGSYNGVTQLVSGTAISCGSQDIVTLQVQNHTFRYVLNQPQVPWQPQRSFEVVIAPDGAFQ